jgi:peptide/nickel transport system substrate-binding protein
MNSRTARSCCALVATLAATSVLAACGGGSTSTSSGASSKPVAGETLTVGLQAAPNSLNPGLVDNAFVSATIPAYDSLIYRASDGSLKPDLATSWKYVGKGNQQLDLTLRSGVTFSDGSPLTAQAVKASLDYSRKAPGPQAAMLAGVSSVDVTGALGVSIKLSAPNPLLPDTLTQYYGVGQIISAKGLANPTALTVAAASQGTGPYVFQPSQSVAGDHYTYTARSGYFDADRQHYKKIVLRVIANPQSVVNALRTGQIDAMTGGDTSVATQVSSAGLKIAASPFVWQGLNLIDRAGTVSKPLGDVRVRQAINYAIDRPTVAKAVLGEYGVPTVQTSVKGSDGYAETAASKYAFNLDKAKQLLKEAGYPNGFTLPVLSLKFAGLDTMGQAIQGQLAQVGIKVALTTAADPQTYVTDANNHKFPAVVVGYGAQPMFLEGQGLFLPTAPVFNGFRSDDPKLTALYGQAAAAAPTERAALDQKMTEYLVDNAWFAPVAFSPVLYYSRADLGGVQITPQSPLASLVDWFDTK